MWIPEKTTQNFSFQSHFYICWTTYWIYYKKLGFQTWMSFYLYFIQFRTQSHDRFQNYLMWFPWLFFLVASCIANPHWTESKSLSISISDTTVIFVRFRVREGASNWNLDRSKNETVRIMVKFNKFSVASCCFYFCSFFFLIFFII